MYLGFKGIRNCILYGHPPVFIVAYIGYLFVGFGSMAFHTTLKCARGSLSCTIRDPSNVLDRFYATCR